MDSTQTGSNTFTKSSKRKKKDSSTDTEDLQMKEVEVGVLRSINKKKIDLLVSPHKEIKEQKSSLEFAHKINLLQSSVKTQTEQIENITREKLKRYTRIQPGLVFYVKNIELLKRRFDENA